MRADCLVEAGESGGAFVRRELELVGRSLARDHAIDVGSDTMGDALIGSRVRAQRAHRDQRDEVRDTNALLELAVPILAPAPLESLGLGDEIDAVLEQPRVVRGKGCRRSWAPLWLCDTH